MRQCGPQEWRKLKEDFSRTVALFNDTLKNIPSSLIERIGVCGNWSPKDVVAHLIGWDKEAAQRIQLFLEGPAGDLEYAIDEFNAKSVAERKHTPWEELLAELYHVQVVLKARFEFVSPTHLQVDRRFWGWLRGRINDYEGVFPVASFPLLKFAAAHGSIAFRSGGGIGTEVI